MFEFNPDLVQGDDDEADDVAYQHEPQDEVRPSLLVTISSFASQPTPNDDRIGFNNLA